MTAKTRTGHQARSSRIAEDEDIECQLQDVPHLSNGSNLSFANETSCLKVKQKKGKPRFSEA